MPPIPWPPIPLIKCYCLEHTSNLETLGIPNPMILGNMGYGVKKEFSKQQQQQQQQISKRKTYKSV